MRHVFFILLYFISFHVSANLPDPVKEFLRDSIPYFTERMVIHEHHELVDLYKNQALIALSYYPELADVKIQFREKNLKTTMAAIPRNDFFLRKKGNRTYRIYIDKKVKENKGLQLKDVPLNAQIGVIAHELGHVVDYESKSAVGIILTGLGYLLPPFRKKLERKVDEITIAHGLGHQVKEFSDYVLYQAEVSDKYMKYKRKYYYKPVQLTQLMMGYPIY